MAWVILCGTWISFSVLMWNFCIQEIDCFGKMAEFINFEAVEDNVDDVFDVDEGEEVYENVSHCDFTYDKKNSDKDV